MSKYADLDVINKYGLRLERYGNRVVHEGKPDGYNEGRYRLWMGLVQQSMQSTETFHKLTRALKAAAKWERQGYYTRIDDRLVDRTEPATLTTATPNEEEN